MFEQFAKTDFALEDSEFHMLNYNVSTFAGQSGSPVLIQGKNTSIGAHVYGGDPNSASAIGIYGNPYLDYVATFDGQGTLLKTPDGISATEGIKFYSIPTVLAGAIVAEGEEGFMDCLRSIVMIAKPVAGTIIKSGFPLVLGSAAGPFGALASIAISAAAKMAESSMSEESFSTGPLKLDGIAERAILGEAALNTVLSMDHDELMESGLFDTMKSIYDTLAPSIKKVAPQILASVMEPYLHITAANPASQPPKAESTFSRKRRPLPEGDATGSHMAGPNEDFVSGLLAPTLDAEEGFFDFIGDVVRTGLNIVRPLVSTAVDGLNALSSILPESAIGGMDEDASTKTLKVLTDRAIVGEAALQALMKLPRRKMEEEGLFDTMKDFIQKVGGQVLKAAPGVIKAVTPIVKGLLAEKAESSFSRTRQAASTSALAPPSTPKLNKKKSFGDLLNDGQYNTQNMALGMSKGVPLKVNLARPPTKLHDENADGLIFQ